MRLVARRLSDHGRLLGPLRVRLGSRKQEDPLQAARSPGLGQRHGLPSHRADSWDFLFYSNSLRLSFFSAIRWQRQTHLSGRDHVIPRNTYFWDLNFFSLSNSIYHFDFYNYVPFLNKHVFERALFYMRTHKGLKTRYVSANFFTFPLELSFRCATP